MNPFSWAELCGPSFVVGPSSWASPNVQRLPQSELASMRSPWPFAQWGIDIAGPFEKAPGQLQFLIVAIDYFTKWVEAEPLAMITGKNDLNFVWKNLVCRFGVPRVLISDNRTQFFKEWCDELKIQQRFTSVTHPQANGQTEVPNRTLVKWLKTRLGTMKGKWVEHRSHVLRSYRTTPRTSNGETPYSFVYGCEAVIPVGIGMLSSRTFHFTPEVNEENHRTDLDLLEERRELAYIREAKDKQQMTRYFNRKVKSHHFSAGDLVLRNEASKAAKSGKLEPAWEGPYQILEVLGKGSYKLARMSGEPIPRACNVAHLKRYYA